jgi:membrane protein implicated in regulation of membrane protease activity
MAVLPLVFAAVPSWIWATLLMAVFVAVSVATVVLVRYPLRKLPRDKDE